MAIRVCLLLIFFGAMGVLRAQHHHYMFIQADQQQPFYVKMGSELLSSSKDGFLIVPRLKDSAYEMIIGFPEKKFPEYRFRFAGFKKDRGLALKNFQEKGWGLFDYQTMDVQMGEKQETPPPPAVAAVPPPITNDAFTVVLASVISDPGLLATPLIAAGAMPVAMASNAVVKSSPEPAVVAKIDPLKAAKDSSLIAAATDPSTLAQDSGSLTSTAEAALKTIDSSNTTMSKSPEIAKDSATFAAVAQVNADKQAKAPDSPARETVTMASPPLTISASEDSIRRAAQEASVVVSEPASTKPSEPVKKKKTVGAMFAGTFKKKEKHAEPGLTTGSEPVKNGDLAGPEPVKGGDLARLENPSTQINSTVVVSDSSATLGPTKTNTAPIISTNVSQEIIRNETVAPLAEKTVAEGKGITVANELREETGIRRTYVDATGGLQTDTVDVFIPFEQKVLEPREEQQKLSIEKDPLPKQELITSKDTRNEGHVSSAVVVGSGKKDRTDCRKMATQADMRALRKKMVAISDEDDMVMAALKDIKFRCYTTIQVRDICAVFTRDEGRYKLIDAAYPYVYDPSQYETLEFLLTDKYFVHRFKALIEK